MEEIEGKFENSFEELIYVDKKTFLKATCISIVIVIMIVIMGLLFMHIILLILN